MSLFSKISLIVTIICLVWCVGLVIFVIVKKIIERVKSKKQIDKYMKDLPIKKSAYEKRTKKSK